MVLVSPMEPSHWPSVRRIYAEGMATGRATFDTSTPDWEGWSTGHRPEARLVARVDAEIVGWAALMPVSSRPCYAGVAEVSIYVGAEAQGHGVGRALMDALIAASDAAGIWTLHSSIHADNPASLALHQAAGFRLIGRRERIARRADGWADTVLMERRSRVNGTE